MEAYMDFFKQIKCIDGYSTHPSTFTVSAWGSLSKELLNKPQHNLNLCIETTIALKVHSQFNTSGDQQHNKF